MSPPAQPAADHILSRFLGILPSTPEETILRMLIELGCEVVGGQEGSLLVYDEREQLLHFAMNISRSKTGTSLVGKTLKVDQGLVGLAFVTREVQTGAPKFKDIGQREREGGTSPTAPEAVIAAPMILGDDVIGVITTVSFEKGKLFSSKDARTYSNFAAIAAIVVDLNRRLVAYRSGLAAVEDESERSQLERRVIGSMQRIMAMDEARLAAIADLLAAVERVGSPTVRPTQ
jgi:transcriptional regulator with GAF, ATPase, and Fis domain